MLFPEENSSDEDDEEEDNVEKILEQADTANVTQLDPMR